MMTKKKEAQFKKFLKDNKIGFMAFDMTDGMADSIMKMLSDSIKEIQSFRCEK